MARLFTMVACNDFSVLKPDFIDEEAISDIDGLVLEVSKTPSHQTVDVEIFYMAFLDFEDAPIEPATDEEIEILNEKLDDFLEEGYVQIVDIIIIPVNGSQDENEIVEMIDI